MSSYVRVSGTLEARTNKAVKLDNLWIPRSCINGCDEIEIDKRDIGDEIEIRIWDWLAKREGLV